MPYLNKSLNRNRTDQAATLDVMFAGKLKYLYTCHFHFNLNNRPICSTLKWTLCFILVCMECLVRWNNHFWLFVVSRFRDFNCFLYVDSPKTEAVFVLLGDTRYPDVTPTERNQMAMCVVLHAPVPLKIDLDRPCFPSARGRYLYVVLARESAGNGLLMIYEIRVYLGE